MYFIMLSSYPCFTIVYPLCINVSVTVLHVGKRKALYKSSLIYNKIYFFRDRSLLIQKIYTLSCLAVMLVDLLAFYYGYHQFTHFQKKQFRREWVKLKRQVMLFIYHLKQVWRLMEK